MMLDNKELFIFCILCKEASENDFLGPCDSLGDISSFLLIILFFFIK